MVSSTLLLHLLFSYRVGLSVQKSEDEDGSFGANLITKLKNDANLDLSVDEEYEDLRAELLAYHTALASLTSDGAERRSANGLLSESARRGLASTPCWELGGICINYKLCSGFRYLTEVHGCRDKLMVCCFTWNRYKVRDWRDEGFGTLALPWSVKQNFGGEGIKVKEEEPSKRRKRKPRRNDTEAVTFIIRPA